MDKVTIKYCISQKAAILAGKAEYGEVTYVLTNVNLAQLTVEEREYLATNPNLTRWQLDHNEHEVSFEAARRVLQADLAAHKAKEAEKATEENRMRGIARAWARLPLEERIWKPRYATDCWHVGRTDDWKTNERLKEFEPGAYEEARLECERREKLRKDEENRVNEERRRKNEAEAEAKAVREADLDRKRAAAIERWLQVYGDKNYLRQRYEEGVLAETELWQAITNQVMDAFGTWPLYEKMKETDVCDCYEVKFSVDEENTKLNAAQFERFLELRKVAPKNATFQVREHYGACDCDEVPAVYRYGVRVCVDFHGRQLCREFSIDT